MSTKSYNIIILRTIIYLNKVTNSKYELNTFAFNENICKLIDKGYQYEHFKKVIDKKWKDWQGTKYQQYVRPQTLFGEKFKSYLNESTTTRKNSLQKLSDSVTKAQRANWRLDKK